MRYGKTIEEEMRKFEPEAMRAFVKYKPLKKLIAQCVTTPQDDNEKSPEESPIMTKDELPDVECDVTAMTSFVETLIEDVIAANQYYNLKYGVIESRYDELYNITINDLQKKSNICCCIKRDTNVLNDIYEILGEMLLLQYFASTDYNGIRKIIKKFKKVTKSTAVDNVMTIINNSPLRDIVAQNDLVTSILNLYLVRRKYELLLKKKGCFSKLRLSYEELYKQIDTERDPAEMKEIRDQSIQMIIDRNLAVPGKDELRDMVYRGHRVLKSRIPKRTSNENSSTESIADSMLIQMAFYMIPAELYSNDNGEVLDSSETILWEGELYRRFSALNQWKPRYVIISNKRICIFRTKYGALKKTLLMCEIVSLYSGMTYRFNECVLVITQSNDAFWFASKQEEEYHSFLQVLKHLYSLVVLNFLNRSETSIVSSPTLTLKHSLYTPIVASLQKDSYSQSYSIQSDTVHSKYTSITAMFDKQQSSESIRARSHSNTEKLKRVNSGTQVDANDIVFLPVLEENQLNAKLTSKRILRDIYSVNSQLEMWELLQDFDSFIHLKDEDLNQGPIDFETTKKREVSKIIEAIQESQASSPSLWTPYLKLYAISLLQWCYPDLARLLQGKQVFQETDLHPLEVNINKLYRYERQIGEGRYSSVWVVFKKTTNQVFAMKKVAMWTLSAYEKQALIREVYNMILLRGHPNIVKLYGFFEDSSYSYLVLELVPGGRLFDFIKSRQSFTEGDAQTITRILLSAVQYCHQNHIVHRDLKPQNILLADSNDLHSIKLADFGFSLATSSHQLTTSLGTPGYTAPEVMRQQPYSSACDMWSIGVITYILLCGYPPFPSNNDIERMKCIATATFHFYPEEWDRISTEAKEFIKKLIVVDPMKRLTAGQALQDPWLSKETAQVNLPRVIQGISTIQQKFALQVCMTNKPATKEVRTHLVKTLVETKVYANCNTNTVIATIPAGSEYPIEISSEIMIETTEYGLLTEYTKSYYHISSKEAWIVLQQNQEILSVHALTYVYKSLGSEALSIFSSPLEDCTVVGYFTSQLLVCDTVLDIRGVKWAVLHHSMYSMLKINGIPQAWIVLQSPEGSSFEKIEETKEYLERFVVFREGLEKK